MCYNYLQQNRKVDINMNSIIKKVLVVSLVIASAYGLTLVPRSSAGKDACMNKFVKAKNDRMKSRKNTKINDGDSTYYHRFSTVF